MEQLQAGNQVTLDLGELIQSLGATVKETQHCYCTSCTGLIPPSGYKTVFGYYWGQSRETIESHNKPQIFALGVPHLIVVRAPAI